MGPWYPIDDRIAVVRGSVNIGVIRIADGQSLLVDTGLDRDSGRRAIREVTDAGWGTVVGILTTHAHADHIGGHAMVVGRTGCEVWASPVEAALTRNPELAPAILYGGDPPATMRGKFVLAAASPVHHIVSTDTLTFADLTIGVIRLPGHSPDQIGYAVGGVCFPADVVFPAETIDKYRIPYLFSVATHRASLERARALDFRAFVPGHGPVLDREAFVALIDHNAAALDAVERAVLSAIAVTRFADEIEATALRSVGAQPADLAAHALLTTTIRGVLSDLSDRGTILGTVEDGRIAWRMVS